MTNCDKYETNIIILNVARPRHKYTSSLGDKNNDSPRIER